jgi:hypothetical protein
MITMVSEVKTTGDLRAYEHQVSVFRLRRGNRAPSPPVLARPGSHAGARRLETSNLAPKSSPILGLDKSTLSLLFVVALASAAPAALMQVTWAGTYASKSSGAASTVTVSGSGGSLTATEHWKAGPRYGSNTWHNCKVSGNTAKCDWTGTYEGDPDKFGHRRGTLEARLSGNTISGAYYEDEPTFDWHVAPYPSAMHKGAVWPFTLTRTSAPTGGTAQTGAPTASQLLAKLKTCTQISKGYATKAGRKRTIPVCGGVSGAVFWTADMDIDCDGIVTVHCNKKMDRSFQPHTALEPGGKPLNAETTRYMVIPQGSKTFNYLKNDIKLGAVVAIIYNGKLTYAVFGDIGPKGIIGEASYATAQALGINPDPKTGGVDAGVTYIVFKGTRVATPGSNDSIDTAGQAAAVKFLHDN